MTVTSLVPVNKARSRVYLDEQFAFVLYKGELRTLGIREGAELEPETYRQITEELLPRRAKLRAMNLLQGKSYTVAALRKKLEEGEYPPAIIEEALLYVEEYRYTDDVRYAADYIRYHAQGRGKRRIALELARKGVSEEDFERAWAECEELGFAGAEKEGEQIRELLRKKRYDPAADIAERERIAAFLQRRGYSAEDIRREMREFAEAECL